MKFNLNKLIIIISIIILPHFFLYAEEIRKLIAEDNSSFGKIQVYDTGGKRFLTVNDSIHSAFILENRSHWVYSYVQLAALATMVWNGIEENRSANVLVIGLGGGIYPQSMIEQYPHWKIDTVEIDPVIARFAREYFYLDKKIKIHVGDGRKFISESQKKYDIIFMDAFGPNYIPPELYTKEYFTLLKEHLVLDGILIINSWENHPYREFEFRTIYDSFPEAKIMVHPTDKPSNQIYFYGQSIPTKKKLLIKLITKNWNKTKFKNFPSSEDILKTISRIPANPDLDVLTDKNIYHLLQIKK